MFTTELILRLRDRCPAFQRRIGGTASFEVGSATTNTFPVPHGFVIPVEETTRDQAGGDVTAQQVRLTFLIVVCVDNTQAKEDGRGLTGGLAIEHLRRELLNALIGWEPITWSIPVPENMKGYEDLMPNSRADTCRYRGGSFIKMTDGRLWHQFEWSIDFFDGRCINVETERHQADNLVVSNNQVVAVDQDHVTSDTATIAYVYLDTEGTRAPTTEYTFNQGTGVLTFKDGVVQDGDEVSVLFDLETPRYYELLRGVYAAYYPSLLEQAGGDPSAITPEMYHKVGELPPDATITWEQVQDASMQPYFSTGVPVGEYEE